MAPFKKKLILPPGVESPVSEDKKKELEAQLESVRQRSDEELIDSLMMQAIDMSCIGGSPTISQHFPQFMQAAQAGLNFSKQELIRRLRGEPLDPSAPKLKLIPATGDPVEADPEDDDDDEADLPGLDEGDEGGPVTAGNC